MSYLAFFPSALPAQTAVVLSLAVGLLMVVIAIYFIAADPKSPITQALAAAYGFSGLAAATDLPFVYMFPPGQPIAWYARFPVIATMAVSAYPLWILRLSRASQLTPRAAFWIRFCVWSFWALALEFLIVGGIYADDRLHVFYMGLGNPALFSGRVFWLFTIPNIVATILLTAAGVILFTQRIDAAERSRALAFVVAFPFIDCIFTLSPGYNLLACFFGELLLLGGAIRFYILQGERGVFMSRFLSPHVADLVRERGLSYTMKPQLLDITVICCDLRGFTNLSKNISSNEVIALLNDYYVAVGAVVAEVGGTIKDYAGDGILILVGAPIPVARHADVGLCLAQNILKATETLIARWSTPQYPLGIGVGVASGSVTVGAIGSAARMEYTAVGPAVNLASRLCAIAQDQEILMDANTAETTGVGGVDARGLTPIKGMDQLPVYAL